MRPEKYSLTFVERVPAADLLNLYGTICQ